MCDSDLSTALGPLASQHFGTSADHCSLVGNHRIPLGQSAAEVQSTLSQEMNRTRGNRIAYLILYFF